MNAWPALQATAEAHTVETDGRLVAGYQVRCTASRRVLGLVWRTGDFAWHWRTADGKHYGDRSNQRTCVAVLREVDTLHHGATRQRPLAPLAPMPRPTTTPPRPRAAAARPEPEPAAPPPRPIVWSDAGGDLTGAIADLLKKRT